MPKSDPAKNYFKSHGGRAWYDRLLHLIKHGDRAALLEHAGGPPELPHMNPSAMNTQDTKKAFDLREVGGFLPWQFPRAHITLPDIFGMSINDVWNSLAAEGHLTLGARVSISRETTMKWPIVWNDQPYLCVGKADYSFLFGDKDNLACHAVIVEAKRNVADGQGQLLAYMAMTQATRRKRGQSDWTVSGAIFDGNNYTFYHLDMDGQFSFVLLQSKREGWQLIADILGSFILKGMTQCSSLRASITSCPSACQSLQSYQRPSLGPFSSIDEILDSTETALTHF
ncbi:hypothetical protein N7508_007050 [Penicillium antarcticum]|uniref:uncharacterized protein n=1 Tax=Penicillium antarcticum TaxID=416450 RepID=UPI002387C6D0|nr:uncharacterized protein N7508_007050 [Penicillium antarcticum]KAJ5302187.1 hypothetical protein N7508_007050 [Penicillium antarcticum]